jgi:3',5'-cyclic AMP phosphodiesterase CpdA
MVVVKIAHISDLHFGAEKQENIWLALQQHLIADQTDLVVVTGDIVDTPDVDLYETARRELRALSTRVLFSSAIRARQIRAEDQGADDLAKIEGILQEKEIRGKRLFVCPGNHDRHPLGNKSKLWTAWNKIRHPIGGDWAQRFEEYLGEFYPNLLRSEDEPQQTLPLQEVSLGTTGNQWRVRVAALDSSLKADKFARGFLEIDSVASLKDAMASTNDIDLGLLLIHHHLLSVRQLEYDRRDSLADLLNSTALINSGSLIEGLASNYIDIALHGHEHESNWGTYGTLEKGGGSTAILGAASGTGVVTTKQCNEKRASYNLVELYPDRSVKVVVRKWDGTKWDGKRYDLLDSQTVRRTRFLRRSEGKLASPPSTEIVRYIEFTRQRAGFVQEYRTNWFPDEQKRHGVSSPRTAQDNPWTSP